MQKDALFKIIFDGENIHKAALINFYFMCIIHVPCTQAAEHRAASCGHIHVQAAIDAAADGDTVYIPFGSCTWTEVVEVPDDKKLLIYGSGHTSTVITSNLPSAALDLNKSGSRVTMIGFILQNDNGSGISVRGSDWRIDHCKLENFEDFIIEAVYAYGYGTDLHPVGLIDHCEFLNTRVLAVGDLSLLAHRIWSEPLGLGTNNAVFVEDCIFTWTRHGNVIDANYGGRYVFRYNTIYDGYIEAHSVQGNNRSARSWEIYNNTINQKNRSMWVPMFLRGGTGVVFNNTLTGTWSQPNIALDNVRSCNTVGDGGRCDGSSPWDGNTSGGMGYPCRDQIGRSTDAWLWTDTTPYPPQELDPAHCWNNKHGQNDIVFFVHNCDEGKIHIQASRDFMNNTPKAGYTPFQYPHPLASGLPIVSNNGLKEQIYFELYPNPVGDNVNIIFYLPVESEIEVDVYDILGRRLKRVDRHTYLRGWKTLPLETKSFSNGIYFVYLRTSQHSLTKKMVVIK